MGIGLVQQNQPPFCHCEPVTDVTGAAIRTPSGQLGFLSVSVPPAGGLPRQCAHWLAMTGEGYVKLIPILRYLIFNRIRPLYSCAQYQSSPTIPRRLPLPVV